MNLTMTAGWRMGFRTAHSLPMRHRVDKNSDILSCTLVRTYYNEDTLIHGEVIL